MPSSGHRAAVRRVRVAAWCPTSPTRIAPCGSPRARRPSRRRALRGPLATRRRHRRGRLHGGLDGLAPAPAEPRPRHRAVRGRRARPGRERAQRRAGAQLGQWPRPRRRRRRRGASTRATRAGIELAEQLAARFAPPGHLPAPGLPRDLHRPASGGGRRGARRGARAPRASPAEFLPKSRARHPGRARRRARPAGRSAQRLRAAPGDAAGAAWPAGSCCTRARRCAACAPAARSCSRPPEGEVRARALVLATNGYTPALGFFRLGLLPLHSHVLATGPLDATTTGGASAGATGTASPTTSTASPMRAARRAGGSCSAAVATRPTRTGSAAAPSRRHAPRRAPCRSCAESSPAISRAWRTRRSSTTGRARSPSRSTASARWACAAHTATCITRSATAGTVSRSRLLAGRVLADLYAGNHEAWRDQPFYQKRLTPLPARAAALARLPGDHAAHGEVAAATSGA